MGISLNTVKLAGLSGNQNSLVKEVSSKDIAIIGIGVILPQADTLDQFWNIIAGGVDCVGEFTQSRIQGIESYLTHTLKVAPGQIKYLKGAYLPAIDRFDYSFFRITPKEASLMNPLQRLFLETAWKAVEDAGYGGKRLISTNTGVYVGLISDFEGYHYKQIVTEVEPAETMEVAVTGNLSSIIPGRISYLLDLKGPSVLIDTACSSSLVAVHLACQALRNGDCDQAIVGGARISLFPVADQLKIGMESSDGYTRAFDYDSNGTGLGEGVIAILLKPLRTAQRDHDSIYAVIKGSAVNQDGNSMGITAPNSVAQAEVLVKAWQDAGINPETLSYFEAHGTGTKLGDPIEMDGIQKAFRRYTDKRQFCAIGSVKTNIGHLYEVAGLAGLVKAVLTLKHKQFPPSLHFYRPSLKINFQRSPVYLNDQLVNWEPKAFPRRCGVSSFGFSGTNCHVVLEEAPCGMADTTHSNKPGIDVFAVSAKSKTSLWNVVKVYQDFFAGKTGEFTSLLHDICYTANTGRGHYNHRLIFTVKSWEDFTRKINHLHQFGTIENEEYFWEGEHRIVTADQNSGSENELTEEERSRLNGDANGQLRIFVETGRNNLQLLEAVCRLYIQGADPDWEILYQGETRNKVHLPTYPFERETCWVDISKLAGPKFTFDQLYYTLDWKNTPFQFKENISFSGNVLIFSDEKGLGPEIARRLRTGKNEAFEVRFGTEYRKIDNWNYEISGKAGDYEQLFEDLKDYPIDQIIHLFTVSNNKQPEDLNRLDQDLTRGVHSLYHMVRTISTKMQHQDLAITLVSEYINEVTGRESYIIPANAPLFGFARVVGSELPHLQCRLLDIDEFTGPEEIIAELNTPVRGWETVYRNGERFEPELTKADLDNVAVTSVDIHETGIYIITGGTGAIGLEMAKFLAANNHQVKIALLNRSKMPVRKSWPKIVNDATDQPLCHKINAIMELESSGAEVAYFSVDISNLADVKNLAAKLRGKYGKINGVIHCAGISGSKMIVNNEPEEFSKVLQPKIHGTWVLDQVTRHDDLDFFIAFSSVISMISIPGQGDYSAANSYLNSFAAFRNRKGKKTLTINWAAWKETGMAAVHHANNDTIFKALPTVQAVQAFKTVFGREIRRVLIGQINDDPDKAHFWKLASIQLAPEIRQALEKPQITATSPDNGLTAKPERIRIQGRTNLSYPETEQRITLICKELLGFQTMNADDNFFDLGVDSILLGKIHQQLEKVFPGMVDIPTLFAYPSIAKLARYLSVKNSGSLNGPGGANGSREETNPAETGIAIIGIAVNLPFAKHPEEFWQIFRNQLDCIGAFPTSRRQDIDQYLQYTRVPSGSTQYSQGAYLESIDNFDYRFFRLSPKEAGLMDPCQRLFLQTTWQALEDAGYNDKGLTGSRIGVYLGFASTVKDSYQKIIFDIDPSLVSGSIAANLPAMIPSRISYLLNLNGPSMVVDTACSSALVAVHLGCQAIRNGECDMAIAGGIKIHTVPLDNEFMKIGIESSDGRTRAFDDVADGAGMGEGTITVILKPLQAAINDRDHVYAVIKGSAVNQDGSSMGITAPNPAAQADVIIKAWENAGINPETISYIETHGTGTILGDPIEITGLKTAFERFTDKKQFCAVGSAKTNLGHLYECAGLANLVKAVLALKYQELPPSINFNKPNRKINFEDSPVYLNRHLRKWQTSSQPRRCGVSAFGFSGTNCHMILEEAPDHQSQNRTGSRNLHIFTLSAKSETSLKLLINDYRQFFNRQPALELADICYTANAGRSHHNCRVAMVIRDYHDLKEKINWLAAGKFDEPCVFYGEHRIVTENIDIQGTTSLTNSKKIELDELAGAMLQQFIDSGQNNEPLLIELCQLYIKGAELAWRNLYQNEAVYRVSLPVYQFEPNRCWVEIPGEMPIQPDEADESLFYHITWKLAEIQPNAQITRFSPAPGCILIFMDQLGIGRELASRLKNEGREVIEVFLGQEFKCVEPGRFMINGDAASYDNLLQAIDCGRLSQVVHLMTITEKTEADSLVELDESLKPGFYSLFYLTGSLLKQPLSQKIDLVITAEYVNPVTGGEPKINPENATLFGLGKVIPKEHPQLICRLIDIDRPFTVDLLKAELEIRKGSGQVAYRNGQRYLEEFQSMDIDRLETGKIAIKDGGVYIITGGTGGMGLEIAGFLAGRNRIKLVLVNRSPFPERELWETIVSGGDESELSRKINQIKAIEATGSEVFCCRADVAKFDEVRGFLDNLRWKSGPINGVIHAAGIGSNQFILGETEETLKATMNSKVYGTWILDRLTRDDSMDFFINMSSIASVFSAPGQGGYAAANSYLDSFTAYRNQSGQKTFCINWTTWKETGMAVTHGVNFDMTFKALPTAQALDALAKVFDQGVSRVIIGRINYEGGKAHLLENQSIQLSPAILAKIDKFRQSHVARFKPFTGQSTATVRLAGRENDDYNEIERKIAELCREILGFTELSIHDSFFQLGADSLMLEKLYRKIDEIYPGKVMAADLFEYETIYDLARYLAGQSAETTETNKNNPADIEKEIDAALEKMEKGTLTIDEVLQTIGEI